MNLCVNAFVIQFPDDLLDTCFVTAPRALLLPYAHRGHCKDEDSYKEYWSHVEFSISLTTQAQRPGARDAVIATTTLPPGSLQRMVRPRLSHPNGDLLGSYRIAASIVRAKGCIQGCIQSGLTPVCAGCRHAASIIS